MHELLQNWQLVVYLITTAFGVGFTYHIVKTNNTRLDRIESDGTGLAQQNKRDIVDLGRRVSSLEESTKANTILLERIDERTDYIMKTLAKS